MGAAMHVERQRRKEAEEEAYDEQVRSESGSFGSLKRQQTFGVSTGRLTMDAIEVPGHKGLRIFSERMRQDQVRRLYKKPRVQWVIAGMIAGNFLSNCIEKQVDPWSDQFPREWETLEFGWNLLFLGELLWNIYGSWYITYWRGHFLNSGWNLVRVTFQPATFGRTRASLPAALVFAATLRLVLSNSLPLTVRPIRGRHLYPVRLLLHRRRRVSDGRPRHAADAA